MPPRFAYWTILAGGLPTAFRATDRDELMPTFQRLREKHPDAELKWFAQGKLWSSPEAARAARTDRPQTGAREGGDSRGRDWRPGGTHRDPRQKFADAKKARNSARRQQRFDRKHGPQERGDRPQGPRDDRARRDRPWQDRPAPAARDGGAEHRPSARGQRTADGRERPFAPKGARNTRDDGRPGTDRDSGRSFDRSSFARGSNEEPAPPRPRGPNREPRPSEDPKPTPPPRPNDPVITPPGPPERGRRKGRDDS